MSPTLKKVGSWHICKGQNCYANQHRSLSITHPLAIYFTSQWLSLPVPTNQILLVKTHIHSVITTEPRHFSLPFARIKAHPKSQGCWKSKGNHFETFAKPHQWLDTIETGQGLVPTNPPLQERQSGVTTRGIQKHQCKVVVFTPPFPFETGNIPSEGDQYFSMELPNFTALAEIEQRQTLRASSQTPIVSWPTKTASSSDPPIQWGHLHYGLGQIWVRPMLGSACAECRLLYLHLQSEPALNQTSDVICLWYLQTTALCSGQQQMTQRNANYAQPYSRAQPGSHKV